MVFGYRTLLGALAVGWYGGFVRSQLMRWGATDDEVARVYPGDELVADASGQMTMAISLPAPPEEVWPWLVQMGHGRAGWYSWDLLDNGGQPSAERIDPAWQDLKVGDRVVTVPNGSSWFTIALLDAPRTLVLRSDLEVPSGKAFDPCGPYPKAFTEGIWAFHLRALPDGGTRLVVRTRGRGRPRLIEWITARLLGEPAHFIMQTRQFQNLRRRVVRPDDSRSPAITGR